MVHRIGPRNYAAFQVVNSGDVAGSVKLVEILDLPQLAGRDLPQPIDFSCNSKTEFFSEV